jgi:hypothetical protein
MIREYLTALLSLMRAMSPASVAGFQARWMKVSLLEYNFRLPSDSAV